MYDLIIIGGGPAGSAAAIYAGRKQLKTLLITEEFGGQSAVSSEIQNWVGTPSISGADLALSLKKHVLVYAGNFLKVLEGEKALEINKNDSIFSIKTNKETFESKAVLVVTGSGRKKLECIGSDKFEHKGITYCVSCDGPMFADQDVIVVGGGNSAFEAATQLIAYTKSITIIHRGASFRAEEITVQKILNNPKVTSILNAKILEVKGDKFVEGLVYKDKISGETKEIPTTGIFVEIGQIPNTAFVKDLVELNEYGKIKIDPWTQKSSLPGIWAAGDCTNCLYHQNNIAVGDATKALENIYQTLHGK